MIAIIILVLIITACAFVAVAADSQHQQRGADQQRRNVEGYDHGHSFH
jgi:hypothetical protein